MRPTSFLVCVTFLLAPAMVTAQDQKPPLKFEQVRVGFRSYEPQEAIGRFKIGLWAPVHIDLTTGAPGLPNGGQLEIETADSEDVGTLYRVPVPPLNKLEKRSFLGFTKPGNAGGEFKVRLQTKDDTFRAGQESHLPLDLNTYLYVTVGARLPDLQEALVSMNPQPKENQNIGRSPTWPRFAAWESEVQRLPTEWFGYESVDLLIMATSNKPFMTGLLRDRERQQALSQWVRQGGRLVVSVSWQTQDLVAAWLKSPAWQPPVPVIPPADQPDVKKSAVKRLLKVEDWARLHDKPFPGLGQPPVPIAHLVVDKEAAKNWEVQADTADRRPLIVRMSYGLGQITLLAFELEQAPFTLWDGRKGFYKALVERLGPRVDPVQQQFGGKFGGPGAIQNDGDVTTQLQVTLDNFDIKVVSFGWVVLFILLYIIVVGPLDFLILKKVFKRLEWTWITFPSVVLLVSLVAYYTAYALKGSELKINQIDIVDFDLRTDLDEQQRPRKAYAYGKVFFTLLSPRIQSYTLGVEPRVGQWLAAGDQAKTANADLISWMGRPEYDWAGGMGRARRQGPFQRRPYEYVEDPGEMKGIQGLKGVHIPVWTSKAFMASWEMSLPKLPLTVDLYYHQNQARDLKVSGTIQNLLPHDLEDVYLFYRDRCYALDQKLAGGSQGSPLLKIALEVGQAKDWVNDWLSRPEKVGQQPRPATQQGVYMPTRIVKELFFLERTSGAYRNHGLRPLDWSWRTAEDPLIRDTSTREAIIYARLLPQNGQAEDLTRTAPLPTHLWMGDLPAPERPRPPLNGHMVQDTYCRFIVPLRPAGD